MAHPTPHPLPPAPGAGRGERRQLTSHPRLSGCHVPLKTEGGPWALGSWWTLGPVPGERPRGTRTLPSGHARPPPAQRQGEKRTAILLSWAGPGRAAAPCSHSLFQLFPATASPNLLGLKPKSKSKQVPFGKFENSPVPFAAVQHSWGQRSQREAEGQWRKEANPLAATGRQVLPGSWSGGGAPHALTRLPGPACPIPQGGGSVGPLALSRSSGEPAFLHAGFLCLYHGGEGTQAPLPDPRRLPTKAGRRTGPGTPESAPAAA